MMDFTTFWLALKCHTVSVVPHLDWQFVMLTTTEMSRHGNAMNVDARLCFTADLTFDVQDG